MALDFPASPTTGDRVTLNSIIYEYDGAKWVTIRSLFDRGRFVAGTAAEPGFSVSTDANTGLYAPGADQLAFTTGGVERVEFGTSEVVFNDDGIDYDFRIEGEADVNLVFADASVDRIGIGTSTPGVKVDIEATEPYVTLKNTTEEDTDGGREVRIDFEGEQSGGEASTLARIEVSHDGAADDEKGKVVISTNDGADGATPTPAVTIDSAQKVTIAGDLETNTINTLAYPDAGALSNRNKIINGDMRIDQRNAGASVPITALHYPVDRFTVSLTQGSGHTTQRSTTAPSNFSNSLQVTVGTGASPAASDISRIYQIIEGYNSADLSWGTAAAKTITISFWVRSSIAGTYAGGLYNAAANRTYVFTYDIQSIDTWEPISVPIPGDTTGTWETTNFGGIVVNWDLGTGSTYQGTAGSWAAGAAWATSSSVKLGATSGATFYITGVQLEAGNTATPFEHKSYSDELLRCQRYYQKLDIALNSYGAQYSNNGSFYGMPIHFITEMRSQPSSYTYSNIGGTNYWVEVGVQAVSGIGTTGLTFAQSGNSTTSISMPRLVGGIPPTRNYYYCWEARFNVLLDAEF